ncbi:uncharacterized protein CCR75_009746 [Bremia lactucae]|uniref:Uncharacterized protein n=1 Tax=Bremia lactucae TaxID=4779 RepID=A0A976FKU5_BRELC|nr:hypothetical protein CCR75_009747 [Bremia lactucae]TDH68374.1 hypothetical protein CCR75_009746 [Bremia lactucae]
MSSTGTADDSKCPSKPTNTTKYAFYTVAKPQDTVCLELTKDGGDTVAWRSTYVVKNTDSSNQESLAVSRYLLDPWPLNLIGSLILNFHYNYKTSDMTSAVMMRMTIAKTALDPVVIEVRVILAYSGDKTNLVASAKYLEEVDIGGIPFELYEVVNSHGVVVPTFVSKTLQVSYEGDFMNFIDHLSPKTINQQYYLQTLETGLLIHSSAGNSFEVTNLGIAHAYLGPTE